MPDMIALIEPLIPGLRRYACGLLRDTSAADDLVQDCLERAIGRWHQRHPDGDARSWLFAILHNLAINRLRRQGRFPADIAVEDVREDSLSCPPTQEAGLHHRDLLDAIARLPTDQRAVLLLVGVEDLSYAEAARTLGIPIGTIMSRLSRGRERLRQELSGNASASKLHLRRIK